MTVEEKGLLEEKESENGLTLEKSPETRNGLDERRGMGMGLDSGDGSVTDSSTILDTCSCSLVLSALILSALILSCFFESVVVLLASSLAPSSCWEAAFDVIVPLRRGSKSSRRLSHPEYSGVCGCVCVCTYRCVNHVHLVI